MKNKTTTILTVIVGVLALRKAIRAQEINQSDLSFFDDEPITRQGGQRRHETPEVVLQLKYDRGELNRIYLAQFRNNAKEWTPSVNARTNLCSDLCYAGFLFNFLFFSFRLFVAWIMFSGNLGSFFVFVAFLVVTVGVLNENVNVFC